ncbi:ribosome recycling factor [Desulfuribacillus stibiiarsenatis]|uniref:Ribosome-recycling factor n=1 Tax=Desulfuribacillus stibiiarsenatis TaxID=1390249 RepID=A0A1E5L6R1_9FIRM|nr:ribosome recycling factor [Desulfuribacillus stibiiarsenatis]OEH85847.1 ribosome recycling factor [Desulfuribacillus stibiiarsenatis]
MSSVIKETDERMGKVLLSLKKDFTTIRAGRANPSLLDKVVVEYYGSPTPINQVANISAPEARLLTIQPWDRSMISEIERAIQKSDLGLSPNNDGNIIRIPLPILTEERRQDLVKQAKKIAEASRVSVRNVRRDANEDVKKMEKNSEISEDESRKLQDDIQKLTDKNIKAIDEILQEKEQEIMAV